MKAKGFLGFALAMAALQSDGYPSNPNEPIVRTGRKPTNKKEEVIPKNCKKYFFTRSGHFFNSMPTGSYTIVYDCIASNDKNAIKKFDKWKFNQLNSI